MTAQPFRGRLPVTPEQPKGRPKAEPAHAPERLVDQLIGLLGDASFVAFCEAFGGRRLYVPGTIAGDHDIARIVGEDTARRLSARFSPSIIRVPLAREYRARHYRAQGRSNGEIASRLGLTETAVDKMFARTEKPPVKGGAPSRQPSLFPDLP